MFNPYKRLLALIPNAPLQVGDVIDYDDGVATIELPGGGIAQARGTTTVGARVFFRDGVVEGTAPDLPIEVIEL
jgi:uncharacterized protein YijF (DUF1287 family)